MKIVLFVCVGNSGRSQMAEAFFNHFAQGKARAISAGTEPAPAVSRTAIEAMRELGIDISKNKPKPLTPEMINQANMVITMGCGAEAACPASWVETRDWVLEDPKDKLIEKVREIRDEIKARVVKLLKELE
ncbi:MAG: arsenate reductase [Chloroflexi bacterium RBG_13_52_14]|nr:MAG: arsenate reductase [Chloroflexi bacterium RBG_13_52_14]